MMNNLDDIIALRHEITELEADRKRLEWLMGKPATMLFAGVNDITCDTREAIDAAMKESDNADTG